MKGTKRYTIGLGLALSGTWLLWSGHFGALLLSLGLLSVLVVLAVAVRMGIVDDEGVPLHLPWRLGGYLPWLAWQIVRANLDVARLVLDPRLPISPRIVRVPAEQASDLARAIYANSITLTPGTVSVDVAGDTITVHALTAEAAEGLVSGAMSRRVRHLVGND